MIQTLKTWYAQHGTKILGVLTSAYASATALLATLSAMPEVQFLLPHKYFAYLAVGNVVLGAFTVKRGFTNSAQPPA